MAEVLTKLDLKNIDKTPELVQLKEKMKELEDDISELTLSRPNFARALDAVQAKKRALAVQLELGKGDKKMLSQLDREMSSAQDQLNEISDSIEIKKLALEQVQSDYNEARKKVIDELSKEFNRIQEELNDKQVQAFQEFLSLSEQLKELENDAHRAGIPFGWCGFTLSELRTRHQPRLPWWLDKMQAREKL